MTLSRRRLAHLAVVSMSSALAGCVGTSAAAIRDVQIVDSGLDTVVKVILLIPTLSKGTQAALKNARDAMDAATKSIVAGSKPTDTDRQAFVNAVNAIIAAAAQIPGLPLSVSAGLGAASVLLPIIERVFGVISPSAALVSASTSSMTAESVLTPDEARDVLGKLAAQQ